MLVRLSFALALLIGCGDSGPASDCSNITAEDVPSESAALFAYLDCAGYEGLASESSVHPSTSAHSSMARVFINDTLEQSLASGAAEHPVGAASVKEIYQGNGTTLRGWAAMVKVEAGSGGDTWFWYENYDTASNDSPVAASRGAGICVPCHGPGRDHFLTPFPLE
jgi:hypothetical protein